jgi:RNA polymerase sigma-70 factor (ECF subfamily)
VRRHREFTQTDEDLVRLAGAGDAAAFVAVLQRHDARLRRLASRMFAGDRHRMDDALQDAYLRAYRSLASYRREADFGNWLYRVTYNACIDEIRRAKIRPHPVDLNDPVWERESTGAAPDARVSAADVTRRALAALPEDQRATVALVDGEGFDHATAAQILGVAPGTVASRLSRARHTMRQMIGEDR